MCIRKMILTYTKNVGWKPKATKITQKNVYQKGKKEIKEKKETEK